MTRVLYSSCLTHLIADMIHTGVGPSPSKTRMKRVTATDGTADPLTGVCVFFLRPNNTKPISSSNVAEVCCAHMTLCSSPYYHVLYFIALVHCQYLLLLKYVYLHHAGAALWCAGRQ